MTYVFKINAAIVFVAAVAISLAAAAGEKEFDRQQVIQEIIKSERARVIPQAELFLLEPPVTVTATRAEQSAGGPHDFYSNGDYSWPDPTKPDGLPYIVRDGESNPNMFFAHRDYLMRLSRQVPALTAAYCLTGDRRYADHAVAHLRAWFIDPKTKMNPSLLYGQVRPGRSSGRSTGIIDTVHLVEVVQAVMVLDKLNTIDKDTLKGVKQWFAQYLNWLLTSPMGKEELRRTNNHSVCLEAQIGIFAKLTGNEEVLKKFRERFKKDAIDYQMAADGSFPQELGRTKPYCYSLFVVEATAACCEIFGAEQDDLWHYARPDGKTIQAGVEFMYPYIKDKSSWPRKPDIMFDDCWPMRQSSLLFAALAYKEPKYFVLWKTLRPDVSVREAVRNFFIRQPILWLDEAQRPENNRAGQSQNRPS